MRILALLLIFVLGSCASNSSAPSNQNDACSILEQRRGWLRDLESTERKWGVPVHVQMAIIWKESSFRARAKTRKTYFMGSIPTGHISTAYGFSQALDGTWEWYQDETGNRRGKRHNFDDATDFIGWYLDLSERKLGLDKNDAYGHYLAYHEGHSGYSRGRYNNKAWLIGVAHEVQAMSDRYQGQLLFCR